MAPRKLSALAADVIFGTGNDVAEIGQLMGLQRKIIAGLDVDDNTGLRIAAVGRLLSIPFVPPTMPELVWDDQVLPVWE